MTKFDYKCETCDIIFDSHASLSIHNFRRHGTPIRSFKCNICEKLFPYEDQF